MTNEPSASHRFRAKTETIHKARPGTMRLWTIQPLPVLENLSADRQLFSDPTSEPFFQDFQGSYDWMRAQMLKRLPDYQGHYPWWAYDYKPDLRGHHTDGTGQYARLELAIPSERVLLSAFGAWHFVLNYFYMPQSLDEDEAEREDDAWDDELKRHGFNPYTGRPLPEPWHSRVTASWERIFAVKDLRETNTIQACFECLDWEDVVQVTVFTPRERGIRYGNPKITV